MPLITPLWISGYLVQVPTGNGGGSEEGSATGLQGQGTNLGLGLLGLILHSGLSAPQWPGAVDATAIFCSWTLLMDRC